MTSCDLLSTRLAFVSSSFLLMLLFHSFSSHVYLRSCVEEGGLFLSLSVILASHFVSQCVIHLSMTLFWLSLLSDDSSAFSSLSHTFFWREREKLRILISFPFFSQSSSGSHSFCLSFESKVSFEEETRVRSTIIYRVSQETEEKREIEQQLITTSSSYFIYFVILFHPPPTEQEEEARIKIAWYFALYYSPNEEHDLNRRKFNWRDWTREENNRKRFRSRVKTKEIKQREQNTHYFLFFSSQTSSRIWPTDLNVIISDYHRYYYQETEQQEEERPQESKYSAFSLVQEKSNYSIRFWSSLSFEVSFFLDSIFSSNICFACGTNFTFASQPIP